VWSGDMFPRKVRSSSASPQGAKGLYHPAVPSPRPQQMPAMVHPAGICWGPVRHQHWRITSLHPVLINDCAGSQTDDAGGSGGCRGTGNGCNRLDPTSAQLAATSGPSRLSRSSIVWQVLLPRASFVSRLLPCSQDTSRRALTGTAAAAAAAVGAGDGCAGPHPGGAGVPGGQLQRSRRCGGGVAGVHPHVRPRHGPHPLPQRRPLPPQVRALGLPAAPPPL
jgi:hypothetical protein